jgi:hypothetical protein
MPGERNLYSAIQPGTGGACGKYLLDLMQHAVGSEGRNYFCADNAGNDYECWCVLVGLGLALQGGRINAGKAQLFHVSDAGIALLRAQWGGQLVQDNTIRSPWRKENAT